MICVIVMTDGRHKCIADAIPSLDRYLAGTLTRRIIHDDSGDQDYKRWVRRRFPGWELIGERYRQGFAGAYHYARAWLAGETVEPFIFSTEDDFVLQRPIDLAALAYVLDGRPQLTQLVAKRQACNPLEEAAGGVVELRPDAYEDRDEGFAAWLEHSLFWSTNPHLTHRDTLSVEWPLEANSEGMFTHRLLRDGLGDVAGEDVRFGFIGKRSDPPLALHIGEARIGTGY